MAAIAPNSPRIAASGIPAPVASENAAMNRKMANTIVVANRVSRFSDEGFRRGVEDTARAGGCLTPCTAREARSRLTRLTLSRRERKRLLAALCDGRYFGTRAHTRPRSRAHPLCR